MRKFLAFFLIFLAGCKNKEIPPPICSLAFQVVTDASQGIAKALDCDNVGAIAASISDTLVKNNLCEQKASGLIGDIICPQVTKMVIDAGVNSLPASWKCHGGKTGVAVAATLSETCKKYVNF